MRTNVLVSLGVLLLALPLAGCGGDERIPDSDVYPGVVLIDDMEDGEQNILTDSGRIGLWYIYSDETLGATQDPAIGFPMYPNANGVQPPRQCPWAGGGPAASYFVGETSCKYVARTNGNGQLGWGAGIGVDLNGQMGVKNPIDASSFAGIGFFARGTVRMNTLRFNVQDVQTTPESAAAADRAVPPIPRCGRTAAEGCNNHFGITISDLSPDWKWYEFPFSMMTQGYQGGFQPAALRTDAVVGIQFQVQGADPAAAGMPMGPAQPFDFSIDNLSFILPR
jgi:hypothetical protein